MSKFQIRIITAALLLFSTMNLFAQQEGILIPSKIKKLYDGDTRSWDGKPGAGYWQNSADYKIDVEVNVDTREIVGKQKITYFNNSPDELNEVVFQLFQDIYKRGNSRDWSISAQALTDGVNIEKFKINGQLYEMDTLGYRYGTNFILDNLPSAIKPNSSITFEMEWDFVIPEISKIRMGKYGDNNYFIAYWYPKIAVYDDYYGWDKLNHSGRAEFYSDNNNYDVKVTLPGDYLVWATGVLQNPKLVLSEDTFTRYQKALASDKVIRIVRVKDYDDLNVTANNGENIWHFAAENVPDFSFACSDNYLWDGVSIAAGDTGERIFTDAAYAPGTINYEKAAEVSKQCIEYLSDQLPGIPFPFPKMTTFCNGNKNGGGMETPMMANNGAPTDTAQFHTLLLHEIDHSLFPFYVYTNESRYAWMDESWATYFPIEYAKIYLPDYDHVNYIKRYLINYHFDTEQDIPIIVPANNLTGSPLSVNSYGKSMIAMLELKKYLGEEIFTKALQEYISRWARKHPLPYDFFLTFNDAAGEDLSWFWKAWYYDFGNCDYALEKNDKRELLLVKAGLMPATINIKVLYDDGIDDIINVNIKEWKDNAKQIKVNTRLDKKIKEAQILSGETLDYNDENDKIIFYD